MPYASLHSAALGIYISIPFCRQKCSYCNFASGVFSRQKYQAYVERVCEDIARSSACPNTGSRDHPPVDSIYLGGGTPTVLEPEQLERIFAAVREHFGITPDAEITVECAPGTLSQATIDLLLRCGVNRVSLGVQSFVDAEARAVGRLHTRAVVVEEIARLRASGIGNINLDLIAGLPHQMGESWQFSVAEAIAAGAPHVSVYMLEVDEDSRLGSELIAGGTRYHAHFVPNDDATADFYTRACEMLNEAGVCQYEISNFARPGAESRHNLKYWRRQPYLGFGVDAHSMVDDPGVAQPPSAVRFATPDSLEDFLADKPGTVTRVGARAALEEAFFLGLRLNRGVDVNDLRRDFGDAALAEYDPVIAELADGGLLQRDGSRIRLSDRGRLVSNEVFERFLHADSVIE